MPYSTSQDINRVYTNFKKMPGEKTDLYYGMEFESVFNWSSGKLDHEGVLEVMRHNMGDSVGLKAEAGADVEMITCPASIDYHKNVLWQNWGNIVEYLNPGSGNGIHIHFSKAGITDAALARLLYFYHAPESNSFLTKVAERHVGPTGCYSMAVKKPFNTANPKVTIDGTYGHRGAAVIGRTGLTVEIRIFQALKEIDHIFSCFDMVAASIAWSTQVEADEKEMIADNFLRWFAEFGKGADYPHLSKKLQKHKLIQEVVATPAEVKAFTDATKATALQVVPAPYGVVEVIRDAVTGRFTSRKRARA